MGDPLSVVDPMGLSTQRNSSLLTSSNVMGVVDFGVDLFGNLGDNAKLFTNGYKVVRAATRSWI